ncbi:MAG: biopolymer transporter ExbD [Chlamydiales bacterium]|nr:biopolymer transporter ExbD [Chlamydiales bacterium]NCF71709.1 biopolymer transporter ExbD [Chlamydiales bacterium]
MKLKTNLKPAGNLIDLTPLVDVIFLLLIFFMVTSDILPYKSINIQHPELSKDTSSVTSELVVTMDAQHVIYLGKQKDIVDLFSYKDHLDQEIKNLSDGPEFTPSVVLSVDKRVDYGTFLKLFALTQECSSKVRLVFKPMLEEEAI